jgi:hypothetical protein
VRPACWPGGGRSRVSVWARRATERPLRAPPLLWCAAARSFRSSR